MKFCCLLVCHLKAVESACVLTVLSTVFDTMMRIGVKMCAALFERSIVCCTNHTKKNTHTFQNKIRLRKHMRGAHSHFSGVLSSSSWSSSSFLNRIQLHVPLWNRRWFDTIAIKLSNSLKCSNNNNSWLRRILESHEYKRKGHNHIQYTQNTMNRQCFSKLPSTQLKIPVKFDMLRTVQHVNLCWTASYFSHSFSFQIATGSRTTAKQKRKITILMT